MIIFTINLLLEYEYSYFLFLQVTLSERTSCLVEGPPCHKGHKGCGIQKRSSYLSFTPCREEAQKKLCCKYFDFMDCVDFVSNRCTQSYNQIKFTNSVCDQLCLDYPC